MVVRGLDEIADEAMLRYEFSKHAPIKARRFKLLLECCISFKCTEFSQVLELQDLRMVRDTFTHVSRGFAFVHFHTVCVFFVGSVNCSSEQFYIEFYHQSVLPLNLLER